MKKEMILTDSYCRTSSKNGLFRWSVCQFLYRTRSVLMLSLLYSRLLEERVSPRRTLHLLHAQVAFMALVLPVPLLVRALFLLWFATAVAQCARLKRGC